MRKYDDQFQQRVSRYRPPAMWDVSLDTITDEEVMDDIMRDKELDTEADVYISLPYT